MLGAGIAAAPPGRGRWLALAGTWTLAELLRWTWPFGGVPLANLAIGQVAGPLAPVLRVGGSLLLVLVAVLAGQAVAAATRRAWRWAGGIALGVVVLVVTVGGRPVGPRGRHAPRSRSCRAAGQQGTRKTDDSVIEVFERHLEATELVEPPVDLVVWPEDVIDTDGAFVDDPWAEVVGELARELDAPIIVGTVEGAGPDAFRNSAVLVDASGEVIDRYDKVHRVPFGEFVPFRSLLEKVAGDALPDRDALIGELPAHLDVPDPVGRVSTPISWEIFFPDRTREGVEDGARLVLNPTNGASFTGTIVQTQQVASSQMRAIESGRWVGQVAPTGFTACHRRRRQRARAHVGERAGGAPARGRAARGPDDLHALGQHHRPGARVRAHRGGLGVPAPRSIVVVTCTASRKARSWVTRSSVPSKVSSAVSELLDGLEVEVVGGLVEHEAVHALRHQLGEQCPGALAGRQVGTGPIDVVGAEPELRQQRAGLAAVEPRGGHERRQQRLVARRSAAGAGRAGRP